MNKLIRRCFYGALFLGFCFLLVSGILAVSRETTINNESVIPFNTGWRYEINGVVPSENQITLPCKLEAEKNDRVVLKNTLPAEFPEGMTLGFRSLQQFVRVRVEGREIYQYGYASSRPFGKSPGGAWNFVRLERSFAGKEIEIELISPYNSYAKSVNEITYGSKNANVFHVIDHNIAGALLSSLIILVGVSLLFAHFILRKQTQNNSLFYLSLFALLAGGWSLLETRLMQFFFHDQFMATEFAFVLVMLLPIPFLLFVLETHALHSKKPLILLCWMFLGSFLLSLGLQLGNLLDFIEFPYVFHACIVLATITLIITILRELIRYKNKDLAILGIGSIIFVSLSMLDFKQFYGKFAGDTSFFFRIGVLIYILILSAHTMRKLLHMVEENMKTKVLEQLAYLDFLTNLQNRTSFERDLKPYREDTALCSGLSFGIFDINNLKFVNDTFGHAVGDTLIVIVARCLTACFKGSAEIYRLGGDEFVLLAKDTAPAVLQEKLHHFRVQIQEKHDRTSFPVQVAGAIVTYDAALDETVHNLYVRADAAMYEEKSKMKAVPSRPLQI